jgi:two-component system sensor histidine kinase RegB
MSPIAPVPSPTAINLRRLIVLRLIVLTGQAFAVGVAVLELRMPLPVSALVAVIAGMALINLLSWWRLQRAWPVREAELFGQLLLDVAALTALLYLSGGSTNPFAPLYLLPLTLTAAALPRVYTWAMALLTVLCYSALLFVYVPLPPTHGAHGGDFQLHVFGMWLGFLLSAGLIAWFAVRMADTLRERDRLAAAIREQKLKHERVLALGTLAAGAAHELGTPLATMAVLVRDMQPGAAVAEERLRTLRGQIDRCKEILSSLSAAAGQVRAESGARLALDVYLNEIVDKWLSMRPGLNAQRSFSGVQPAPCIVTEQTLSQAIVNILNNAADASPQSVGVDGRWSETELVLEIADRGAGLAPEIEKRAGQPFFADGTEARAAGQGWPECGLTTKSEGLGLGLFLAYTTLQRLGGSVRLLSREGGGVLCRLTLPLAPLRVSP